MRKPSIFLTLLALALTLPGLASAHGSRHRSSVHWSIGIGTGYYAPYYSPFYGPSWPGYWGPSVVYSAPVYTSPPVVVKQTPPVYIERPIAEPPATAYWYYCAPTNSYYPYVSNCDEAWQRVSPIPPSTSANKP